MHDQGIIHRDLKHNNIFVSDNGPFPKIKIGDLGSSCLIKDINKVTAKVGTLNFMAPEAHREEVGDGKQDVWSLGIILH